MRMISGDNDERVVLVSHRDGTFHGFVERDHLLQRVLGLVSVMTVIYTSACEQSVNPLTPIVAIWVQL